MRKVFSGWGVALKRKVRSEAYDIFSAPVATYMRTSHSVEGILFIYSKDSGCLSAARCAYRADEIGSPLMSHYGGVFYMEKNNKSTFQTRTLVFLALLVAMQIVLVRIVSIDLGFARVTIGNLPVVLAGMWFGPVAGALTGLVADVLGCFMRGYAVNPLITLSVIVWGVIPVWMSPLMTGSRTRKMVVMSLALLLTSVIGTVFLTTLGLVLMNGYDLRAILPSRLIQWAVLTPVYCVLVNALYFSPLTELVRGAARKAA